MNKIKFLFLTLAAVLVFGACSSSKDDDNALKSSEKNILTFTINEVAGIINASEKTVKVVLPYSENVDVTKLTPTITVSAKATVSPVSGTVVNFTEAQTFTVTAEDGSKSAYKVTVEVAKSSDAKINSFSFKNLDPVVEGVINEEEKSIKLVVPYGTDFTTLVSDVKFTGKTAVADTETPNFEKPVTYTVTAADGITTAKYTVTVTVADLKLELKEVTTKDGYIANEEVVLKGTFLKEGNQVFFEDAGKNEYKTILVKESSEEITVLVPLINQDGDYTVVVYVDKGKESEQVARAQSTTKILNPYFPSIETIASADGLVEGNIQLTLIGENLSYEGLTAFVTITKVGGEAKKYNVIANKEGTELTFEGGVIAHTIGDYSIFLTLEKEAEPGVMQHKMVSNTRKYTVEAKPEVARPEILEIDNYNPSPDDIVKVIGANFAEANSKIYLRKYIGSGENGYWGDEEWFVLNPKTITPVMMEFAFGGGVDVGDKIQIRIGTTIDGKVEKSAWSKEFTIAPY